jgi:tetratricopeptide (TPR) repeat protein
MIYTDSVLALRMGEYYFNWGNTGAYDIEKAERYLLRSVAIDDNTIGVHYHLGRIAFLNGKFNRALSEFEKELELLDGQIWIEYYYPAVYMQGLTHGFAKNFNQSAFWFEHLIADNVEDPRSWAYYTDLAWVYFQQGRFEELLSLTKEAITRYPNNPWVLNMHALGLMNAERDVEAHRVFLQAKREVEKMEPGEWGLAYPGNNPNVYAQGLEEMKQTIMENIETVSKKVVAE